MSAFQNGLQYAETEDMFNINSNIDCVMHFDAKTSDSKVFETTATLQCEMPTTPAKLTIPADTELRRSCRSIKKSWKVAEESPYLTEDVGLIGKDTTDITIKTKKSSQNNVSNSESECVMSIKKEVDTESIADKHGVYKLYKCHKCKYSTNIAPNLKQHVIRMHSQVFACSVCDANFCVKKELMLHSLLHTKPYACKLCDKRYKSQQFLSRHSNTAHTKCMRKENSSMQEQLVDTDVTRRRGLVFDDEEPCGESATPHQTSSTDIKSDVTSIVTTSVDTIQHANLSKSTQDDDEFPFKCVECDYKTTNQINLSNHLQRMHKERLHICDICSKAFGLAKDLAEHVRWHLKPHECTVCGQHFAKSYLLKAHIAKIHPESTLSIQSRRPPTPRQSVYTCSHCPYMSHVARYLRNHVMRNHGERTHQCSTCGKSFALAKDLKQHESFHLRKAYICSQCSKVLHSKFALRLHVHAIHDGVRSKLRKYLCALCGKLCSSSTAYREHQNREHLHVRPFVCSVCNSAFHGKSTLKLHMIRHQTERKFMCEACNKCFKTRGGMRAHKAIHQKTRPFQCGTCNKGFTQKGALARHLRIHTGERPFKCLQCSASFNDLSILRRHMIGIHKVAIHKRGLTFDNRSMDDGSATPHQAASTDVKPDVESIVTKPVRKFFTHRHGLVFNKEKSCGESATSRQTSSTDIKPDITSIVTTAVDTTQYSLPPVSDSRSQLLETALLECGDDASNAWLKYKNYPSTVNDEITHDRHTTQTNLHQLIEAVRLATPDDADLIASDSVSEPIVCASEVVVQTDNGEIAGDWPTTSEGCAQIREVELHDSKQIASNQWLVGEKFMLSSDCTAENIVYSLDDQHTLYIVSSAGEQTTTTLNL